jgi:hypothetical protein
MYQVDLRAKKSLLIFSAPCVCFNSNDDDDETHQNIRAHKRSTYNTNDEKNYIDTRLEMEMNGLEARKIQICT